VRRNRGYTLMEMMLVLAVLVVMAAISAPLLNGVMRRANLTNGGDLVRTDLTRAHVKAMKTGRIQVFYFEPGGRKYRVQPWIADDDELQTSQTDSQASAGLGQTAMEGAPSADVGEERELPEGITFAAGEAVEESRGMVVSDAVAGESGAAAEWSQPILFYPDGSSSDAYVVVADAFELGMRIDLTGLTGTAKVGLVSPLETLLQ
jgi:prepilin-type N-terminal cleavage/methylation domain-containing protein